MSKRSRMLVAAARRIAAEPSLRQEATINPPRTPERIWLVLLWVLGRRELLIGAEVRRGKIVLSAGVTMDPIREEEA